MHLRGGSFVGYHTFSLAGVAPLVGYCSQGGAHAPGSYSTAAEALHVLQAAEAIVGAVRPPPELVTSNRVAVDIAPQCDPLHIDPRSMALMDSVPPHFGHVSVKVMSQ